MSFSSIANNVLPNGFSEGIVDRDVLVIGIAAENIVKQYQVNVWYHWVNVKLC